MQEAFFLKGAKGGIFCIGTLHAGGETARQSVVIVPPFAEEMNKTRHLMAALARRIAGVGYDVLLFDFFGTGDSEGDFADSSIAAWRSDIDAVIRFMNPRIRLHLVGFRAGALMAADAASRHDVHSLTLVQPHLSGRQQLDEVLRLRLTAALMDGGSREGISALRNRLMAGETLEIGGYGVSRDLAVGLDSLELSGHDTRTLARVNCMEIVSEPGAGLRAGLQKAIDAWKSAGVLVNVDNTVCSEFWATRETAPCPELVDEIVQRLVN
jgi:exosortase A-associated hydrolase 2